MRDDKWRELRLEVNGLSSLQTNGNYWKTRSETKDDKLFRLISGEKSSAPSTHIQIYKTHEPCGKKKPKIKVQLRVDQKVLL